MLTSYVIGIIAFAIHVVLVPVLLRFSWKISPVAIHVISAFAVHVATTVTGAIFFGAIPYWQGAALYWLGFMLYIFVFSSLYKSISLKIIHNLSHQPKYSAHLDVIFEKCIKASFTARVDVLVESSLAERRHDGFVITRAGIKTADRIRWMQRLFGIERSGLYFVSRDNGSD